MIEFNPDYPKLIIFGIFGVFAFILWDYLEEQDEYSQQKFTKGITE